MSGERPKAKPPFFNGVYKQAGEFVTPERSCPLVVIR